MTLKRVALVMAASIGLFIIYVGVGFLLTPQDSASGFGFPVWPQGEAADFLVIKGVRDIGIGLVLLAVLASRQYRALGWATLAATFMPAGDAIAVLTNDGSVAIALGVHAATALYVLVSGVLLLYATRARTAGATATSRVSRSSATVAADS